MRRATLWTITFVGGLFFLLEFVTPARWPGAGGPHDNPLTAALPTVTQFTVVIGTMAFLLGPINLVRSHLGTILRRRKGWLESGTFLVFLVAAVVAQGSKGGGAPDRWADVLHGALVYGVTTAFFASSMAMLAFYLVSAAHRAFRLGSLEAGVMMAAAVVVLLGQVPLGDWLLYGAPDWLQFRAWAHWVLACPNTGVQRAVLLGACGGAFAAGVRHWLGLGGRRD